jgi:hypothetical protein
MPGGSAAGAIALIFRGTIRDWSREDICLRFPLRWPEAIPYNRF